MLVLTRKVGQRIVIAQDIVVTLLDIKGGAVRIGIDAPRDVPVFRTELSRSRPPQPVAGSAR